MRSADGIETEKMESRIKSSYVLQHMERIGHRYENKDTEKTGEYALDRISYHIGSWNLLLHTLSGLCKADHFV